MNPIEWMVMSLNLWGVAGDLGTQQTADDDENESADIYAVATAYRLGFLQ